MNNHLIRSYNPATDELVFEIKASDENDVEKAIENAKKAALSWSLLPIQERIHYLKNYADLLQKNHLSLAELISKENGKPLWDAMAEVAAMIAKVDISITAYQERCKEISFNQGQTQSVTRFKPHGTLAVFGPFNFPGHLPNGHIVPALLAGNTIVFKPSEQTPLVGKKLYDLFEEAGLPRGTINLLQGGALTGKWIVANPNIDGILFTGSYKTGAFIQSALPFTKILALEMGGNNPLIISKTDDIKAAVQLTIQSAFLTSGQRCSAARRLIIIQGIQSNEFLNLLEKNVKELRVGSYTDKPEPFMGPVISNEACERLLEQEKRLIEEGGLSIVKMHRIKENRPFLTPGLIDVTKIVSRKDEEIFGPLLQVILVKDLNDAIKEANNTAYGLTAGIVTSDPKEYEIFWQKAKAGVVNWNTPLTGASSKAPFGGIGHSGNHRPSALFAADYCSYPVASLEKPTVGEKL